MVEFIKGVGMKKIHKDYLDFLAKEGYAETFPQANVRILFNTKDGKVEDLIVEDFSDIEEKKYLYKKYSFDIGNCLSDWSDWSFSDVLIKIFVSYEVPTEIRKKYYLSYQESKNGVQS